MGQNRYNAQFIRLKDNQYTIGNTTYKARISKLKKLRQCLENTYKQRLRDALWKDFKKPQLEVDFTEIYPVIDEIKHVSSNLKFWLKRQPVSTPIALIGSSSYIKYEPKGVCLIISPWNFPVNLTFGPLVSAIAAGNTVILKPSEMTPHTTKVMADIIHSIYKDDEVILLEGDAEVSKELLKLPFNHIFFTGSPAIGKLVMRAAAEHLTSVTLELGGKSPAIIDASVNLKEVSDKIAFGKFLNAGQTCIAPDYVYIEESLLEEFKQHLNNSIKSYYGTDIKKSDSYANIVNERHAGRLAELINDATDKGAELNSIEAAMGTENAMVPTIVTNVSSDMKLMQDEIFGPILPVKTYKTLDEVVDYINENEKPLALYIFSKSKKTERYLIENTRAGTTAVNHNLLQFLNHNLPFGGSNNSGIGKSHGIFGFKEFSNARSVLKQHTISPADLLKPPYTNFKQKIVDLTIKYF